MPDDDIVTEIVDLFAKKGSSNYGGEAVSQLEHALQTAAQAREAGCRPELVCAALLHDVGHLVEGVVAVARARNAAGQARARDAATTAVLDVTIFNDRPANVISASSQ